MSTPIWNPQIMVPWWWRFGLPSPIWFRNVEVIQQIIEKHNLEPISEVFLPRFQEPQVQMDVEVSVRTRAPAGLRPLPFPGGLKIAHVHYEGQVYALGREQWQEFSTGVVQRLKQNLEAVRGVSFQQLLEVSDVLETI